MTTPRGVPGETWRQAGGRREAKPFSIQVYLAVIWVSLSSPAYLWNLSPCASTVGSEVQTHRHTRKVAEAWAARGQQQGLPGNAATGNSRRVLPPHLSPKKSSRVCMYLSVHSIIEQENCHQGGGTTHPPTFQCSFANIPHFSNLGRGWGEVGRWFLLVMKSWSKDVLTSWQCLFH